MPLSESEKAATRAILSYLTEEETFFLAETVSQRIVRAQTLLEAEEVVLQFSNDFEQLLKRQKMKREYLLRFIIEHQLPNRDLVNAEKRTLIREIMEYTSGGGGGGAAAAARDSAATVVAATEATTTATTSVHDDSSSSSLDVGNMASLFAKWFYAMINCLPQQQLQLRNDLSTTTTSNADNKNNFGPHHFVENCRLNLRVRSGGGGRAADEGFCHSETVAGGLAVAERLAHFCVVDGVVFNANLDAEACVGKKEPHGLVMLQISGTLMRNGCLIGVFDQSFGLLKEPQTDNWKIQVTNLAMQTGPGSGTSPGHESASGLRSLTS